MRSPIARDGLESLPSVFYTLSALRTVRKQARCYLKYLKLSICTERKNYPTTPFVRYSLTNATTTAAAISP